MEDQSGWRANAAEEPVGSMTTEDLYVSFLSDHPLGYAPDSGPPAAVELSAALTAAGSPRHGPNIVPYLTRRMPPELRGRTRALVCRPTWGGVVDAPLVEALRPSAGPFTIATLSSGVDHIALSSEQVDDLEVRIIRAEHGNAHQVAEFTLFTAIALRRRVLSPVLSLSYGELHRVEAERGRSLVGTTWCAFGFGAVVRAMIPRLVAAGSRQVRVWVPAVTDEKVAQLGQLVAGDSVDPAGVVRGTTAMGDFEVRLETTALAASQGADVVSLHVPLTHVPVGSYPATAGLLDQTMIANLAEGAVIINAARRGIIDEPAALAATATGGRVAGFASDVLGRESEERGALPDDPVHELWQLFGKDLAVAVAPCAQGRLENVRHALLGAHRATPDETWRNLLVTPHIAGTSQDATDAVADEVFGALIVDLLP